MDKQELAEKLKCVWEDAPDSKLVSWRLVADYVLENFTFKEEVKRDYVKKEEVISRGLFSVRQIYPLLGLKKETTLNECKVAIERLKEIERDHNTMLCVKCHKFILDNPCDHEWVKYDQPQNGYKADKELADKHLVVGNTYKVGHIEVDNWRTDIYLKDFPNIGFNSVLFSGIDKPKPHPGVMVSAERFAEIERECGVDEPRDLKPSDFEPKDKQEGVNSIKQGVISPATKPATTPSHLLGGKCVDCGIVISATSPFTVCDTCWDKAHKNPISSEMPPFPPEWLKDRLIAIHKQIIKLCESNMEFIECVKDLRGRVK